MTVKEITRDIYSVAAVQHISDRYNEPEWLWQNRLAAWETFESLGWPTYKEETWRRTRLTGFNLDTFTPATDTHQSFGSRDQLPPTLAANLEQIDSAGALIFQDGSLIYADLDEELSAKGVSLNGFTSGSDRAE